jgi:hypothetical protein
MMASTRLTLLEQRLQALQAETDKVV